MDPMVSCVDPVSRIGGKAAAMTNLDDEIRSFLVEGKTEQATTQALRALGPEILGFLSGVLGDDDGDEAFSAFSERLWKSLAGFEGRCKLRTWAYVLARNEISRFLRGARRHAERRVPISGFEDILEDVRKTRSTLVAERRSTLTRLRDELPIEDRTLLILRVDRDLSFEEIALAFADNPEVFPAADKKREVARLRKRFQLVKERLMARVRETGADR
jgi:RNA polymerase sigma-70 factor (ECF subfamily)